MISVYTIIKFSWDHKKASANLEKHSVSFEEAATLFDDPRSLEWEDQEHSLGERRLKRLGRSNLERILMVVYTLRRMNDVQETIRIISARQASRKERQAYAG